MWNHERVSGYLLITLFVSVRISLNTTSAFQLSTVSSAQTNNLTWMQMKTQNPFDSITHQSINSTKSDNDELSQHQEQKRRKRRRNRKPRGRIEQVVSRNPHQLKKHSTRVHVDQPVQFWSTSRVHDTTVSEATFITQLTTRAPPPARYLLPPFFNIDTNETAIAVPKTEVNSKFKTLPTHRGSTKFKNTIYYLDYRENEIDTNQKDHTLTSEGDGRLQLVTRAFKPIIVQPTPFYISDHGATAQVHSLNDKSEFVSAGVAAAGMQVISTSGTTFRGQPMTSKSRYTTSEFIRMRDQPLENFEHRTSETSEGQKRTLQDDGLSPAELETQYDPASELNLEVDVLPPIQFTYGWENLEGFNETSKSSVVSQLNSSLLNDDTYEYKEMKPSRSEEDAERSNYQPQPLHIMLPKSNISSTESNRGHTPLRMNAHDGATTTPILQDTPISTRARAYRKQSSGKGLDLAETQYSSDLLSKQQVSSLFQNESQQIPGAAGKDYPIFGQSLLQKRRFACRGLEGYFADISARCQVFYICNGNGAGEPMLCPNGTLFSQDLLVCDWWYNVDC